MADQLPIENMYNILSRMPVKSLARMRCVSKQWCNYINDPYLESMHAKRATPTNPMLVMVHQFTSNHPNSQCILAFLEYKEKPGTCTLQVTRKPLVMEFMLCTELCLRYPNDIILGSCNGLIYSSRCNHDTTTTLVVINPLRKERYELPPMKTTPIFHYLQTRQRSWWIDLEELSRRLCVKESSGLGFDDSTKTFKMVCIVLIRVHNESPDDYPLNKDLCTMVHVLGTNSWRKIPQVPSFPMSGEGVFVNGCLHWLISDEYDDYRDVFSGRAVITFDMAKEEFGVINPPQKLPSGLVNERLVDLHGEVGYVYHAVNRRVEVWVLKADRGWVMHCEFEHKHPLRLFDLIKVLGFWNENGDVLMMVNSNHMNHMIVYNLKNDGLYEVEFDFWEEKPDMDIRLYQSSLFSTRYSIKN